MIFQPPRCKTLARQADAVYKYAFPRLSDRNWLYICMTETEQNFRVLWQSKRTVCETKADWEGLALLNGSRERDTALYSALPAAKQCDSLEFAAAPGGGGIPGGDDRLRLPWCSGYCCRFQMNSSGVQTHPWLFPHRAEILGEPMVIWLLVISTLDICLTFCTTSTQQRCLSHSYQSNTHLWVIHATYL